MNENIASYLERESIGRKDLYKLLEEHFFTLTINDFKYLLNVHPRAKSFCSLGKVLCLLIAVCEYFNIEYSEILSTSRKKPLPYSRFIFCYIISKTITTSSGNKLSAFIDKAHDFMDYSKKEVTKSIDARSELYFDYRNIEEKFNELIIQHNLNYNPYEQQS